MLRKLTSTLAGYLVLYGEVTQEIGRIAAGFFSNRWQRFRALPAFAVGRDTPEHGAYGDDWTRWTPFTYPFNITEQPAVSVPCGLTKAGLPAGLQIVGAFGKDALVLRAAAAFEQARPFARVDEPVKPI